MQVHHKLGLRRIWYYEVGARLRVRILRKRGQTMGPIGVQEMIAIFLVALVLFGPKKLPELGRTIGKAISEFRRATSDLKTSFEREMHNLERETDALKEKETQQHAIESAQNYASDYEYHSSHSSEAYTYTPPAELTDSAQDRKSVV